MAENRVKARPQPLARSIKPYHDTFLLIVGMQMFIPSVHPRRNAYDHST
jgi:hypothetical protein